MNDDNGQLLAGRYRLTHLLGQGGMGAVWRAHDEQLGRDVAVKELRLPEHLGQAERENWIARLDREARAAARLKHPGIITVHDRIAGPDGRPWIVMELVDGGSLADLVDARGALPPRQVADIGGQVAAALDAAHRMGITHRDIKPANILLEGDRVVLTDFGIAALEGDATLTATGMIMGTPAYMAPEQVRGLPATAESDLWSLGATLYAAVEGRAPFEGTAPSAVLVAVATEEPAPAVRAGLLGPVLDGLLRKDPGARLTMEQLRTRLSRAASSPSTLPVAPPASLPTPTAPSWSPAAPDPDARPTAGPASAQEPAAAPRRSTPRRRAVLSGLAVLAVTAASVTGYALYRSGAGQDYEANRAAADALTAPTGFTRESASRTPQDSERVTYAKDDACDDLCTAELDQVRDWMIRIQGVAAGGAIETALDKCLTTEQGCVIPVTNVSSYDRPTLRQAVFRAAGGRLYFVVDMGR
ncbi:protein kinase [Streptomyces sp. NPDC012769]|uniref:serine/threonine-protein kinase n=1 Tax=Streptomyces sp. NPDC012769 TaxID=3364848 RepID=UPI00367FDC89